MDFKRKRKSLDNAFKHKQIESPHVVLSTKFLSYHLLSAHTTQEIQA